MLHPYYMLMSDGFFIHLLYNTNTYNLEKRQADLRQ